MTHPPSLSTMPMTLAGIAGLGPWELLIVLAIILVVFGAGKLPNIGNSLGQAIRNFKKGMKGEDAEGQAGDRAENKTDKH